MAAHSAFKHILLLLGVALMSLVAVDATRIMHRPPPEIYHSRPRLGNPHPHPAPPPKILGGGFLDKEYVSFAYFTNWGIYGADYLVTNITDSYLTHILYAFADTDPINGTVFLTDSYSDEQILYPGDSGDDPEHNLYGNLKQLYLLKLQRRNLKRSFSPGDFNFVTNSTSRAIFVQSAVEIVENYGFDGVDIDFEYPANTDQQSGLAALVTELRFAFDVLAARKGDSVPYQITFAAPAGAQDSQFLDIPKMNAALSYWSLMGYDYAGPWLNFTDNQANVFGGARTGVSSDMALNRYISQGATACKMNLGMPLYGRAFEDTDGLGDSYNGVGPGTLEAGVYSYNVLPFAGATVYENATDITSYSYDPVAREFVTYDTPDIVNLKVQYLKNKGLAGSMFWELSTDKVGPLSLVGTASQALGQLDRTPNHI
ncbi:hypothetical protein H0H81_011471, partial [Sphagnurus paluster]